ncbi:MAG: tetratricopeptide repeat protein [Bacteroidota bacterium]
MRTYLSLIIFLGLFSQLPAQENLAQKAQEHIYKGYSLNIKSEWDKGLKLFEQAFQASQEGAEVAYQWTLAQYGYIGYCKNTEKCGDLLSIIETAQKRLKKLIKTKGESSPYSALMGGLIAMEIEMKPAQMMFLGPKCSSYINESVEFDAKNPRAWVEKGNLRYHAPGIFGGDMEEAIECFKKAIQLFEQDADLRKYSWQYLHALAWLGKAYEEEGETDLAIKTYRHALEMEPSFSWVKKELLPQALSTR